MFYRCQIYSPSGDAFLSPVLSISAPIFLETLGACALVCGAGARRKSVAASATVAMGGLFGAVLSTPIGALIVSVEARSSPQGPFVANLELNESSNISHRKAWMLVTLAKIPRGLDAAVVDCYGT